MTMPTPDLQAIDSTMFSHHHYDPDTRVMTVRYKESGKLYQHDDVPAEKNDAFLGSASKGGYYNKKIKPNHPGRKVEG
jgi:hypothetical protein